jgi:hypothetical protein
MPDPKSNLICNDRWAVVVGINQYVDVDYYNELKLCVRDADAVRKQLLACGFEESRISTLTDQSGEPPTRPNILKALRLIALATGPEDVLLFYYSGHGDEENGESYLVGSEGQKLILGDTAVPLSRVVQIMNEAPARGKIIVLDACHSGLGTKAKGSEPFSAEFIHNVFQQAKGLTILASCQQGQVSYEWPEKGLSAFTHFFLEALQGRADFENKGFITVQDVYRYVLNGVKTWAFQNRKIQTPTMECAVEGDIILADFRDRKTVTKPRSFLSALDLYRMDDMLEHMASEFLTLTKIAGLLRDEEHNKRAMYLDTVYVHREKQESAVFKSVRAYAEEQEPSGKWISIVGDAGHGKTSLLWYLLNSIKEIPGLSVMPFQAQLLGHDAPERIKTTILETKKMGAERIVVLLDTLDILVGLNDPLLRQTLNTLRASGCLLITCSRIQEATRISKDNTCDQMIELGRYSPNEVEQAIRNYIECAYSDWPENKKNQQFVRVSGILEQRREQARELDLEPLILRMIFEAYVPEDIPQDINTQQVYDRFWSDRVLEDRVIRDREEKDYRAQLCRLLASQVAFRDTDTHSDTYSLNTLSDLWRLKGTNEGADFWTLVEGLHSSGVLQWAKGRNATRFFHQTFFEYTAALDLLCLDDGPAKSDKLALLLEDVNRFNLFRVPILKQVGIQAYYQNDQLWKRVIEDLRQANTELSAQLALEIIGKIQDVNYCLDFCKAWIKEDGEKMEAVVRDTLKYYPRRRVKIALDLLELYLNKGRDTAIYGLCRESFASIAPDLVYEFLHKRLDVVKSSGDDEKSHFKEALCAPVQYGVLEALNDLAELLPYLKSGQKRGMLLNIAEAITDQNANKVADFLFEVFNIIAKERQHEVWDAFLLALMSVNERLPELIKSWASSLLEKQIYKTDVAHALVVGRVVGTIIANESLLKEALLNITSGDHITRLMSTELLYGGGQSFSDFILDQLSSADSSFHNDIYISRCAYKAVAGCKNGDASRIFLFLEKWPCPGGAGAALREIFPNLSRRSPDALKKWMLRNLNSSDLALCERVYMAFNILAQDNIHLFEKAELTLFLESGFESSKEIERAIAGVVAYIAHVDEDLSDEAFLRILHTGDRDCRNAAIWSLKACLDDRPEFLMRQAKRVVDVSMSTKYFGYLHSLLEILKSFPRKKGDYLLNGLDRLFTQKYLEDIRDEKTIIGLLLILKIYAVSNASLALDISDRCILATKGVAGALSALYENITNHSDDPWVLNRILDNFTNVLGYRQTRIGNSLRRALLRLDEKLKSRRVVGMFFSTYKQVEDQKTLEDFVRAVIHVPSFTDQDAVELLNDPDLPSTVRGIVLGRNKRK